APFPERGDGRSVASIACRGGKTGAPGWPGENEVRAVGAMACDAGMAIELGRPGVDELGEAVGALRGWQHEGAPMQLHPGDLGWLWRFGAEATAAAVRIWRRDGRVLAVGLLDGPTQLR